MSEADPERHHEQQQRNAGSAHEHAASVHDQAAKLHEEAATFFDKHEESGKADHERDLVGRETQAAEADRREEATQSEDRPPSDQ